MPTAEAKQIRQFPCKKCGASLEFKPGASSLACPYCGHKEEIPQTKEQIQEYAFNDRLAPPKNKGYGEAKRTAKCPRCAAQTSVDMQVESTRCAFCGTPIVIDDAASAELDNVIRPEAILPFKIEKTQAEQRFRDWVKGLWFAPNTLKNFAALEKIVGLYRPYWTFDAHTANWYEGERGDHYYETEHYTETVNGKTEHRTRQVQKTRWSHRSGSFERFFDDVLVDAGRDISWRTKFNLAELVPFNPTIMAGWNAERYTLELDPGWGKAKEEIDHELYSDACGRIGGDEQRGVSVKTAYSGICYKHILLPLFMASYQYGQETYRFQVNGQTGEVNGNRPWSFWKIFFLVAGIIGAIVLFMALSNR